MQYPNPTRSEMSLVCDWNWISSFIPSLSLPPSLFFCKLQLICRCQREKRPASKGIASCARIMEILHSDANNIFTFPSSTVCPYNHSIPQPQPFWASHFPTLTCSSETQLKQRVVLYYFHHIQFGGIRLKFFLSTKGTGKSHTNFQNATVSKEN